MIASTIKKEDQGQYMLDMYQKRPHTIIKEGRPGRCLAATFVNMCEHGIRSITNVFDYDSHPRPLSSTQSRYLFPHLSPSQTCTPTLRPSSAELSARRHPWAYT